MEPLVKLCTICWVCMSDNAQHSLKKQITSISRKFELFFLFVTCTYTSIETTVFSWSSIWVWSSMPKVSKNNRSPISLEEG